MIGAECGAGAGEPGEEVAESGEGAGIGVEYDEEAAARFAYDPKYLPVNTLADGSVHDR